MLIVISGYSCVGKDKIVNALHNKCNIEVCVSDTTRPPREGEVDGKDYNFISLQEFIDKLKNKEYIEFRKYDTAQGLWLYGLPKSSVNINKIQLVILDAQGYEKVVKEYGQENVLGIYVYCDEKERVERALNRSHEDNDKKFYEETYRRLGDDLNKFDLVKLDKNIIRVDNSNGQFDEAVNKIIKIIINKQFAERKKA